jgi:hypothetical protein
MAGVAGEGRDHGAGMSAPKTQAERKAEERARKREAGLEEVRGLWLTKDERERLAVLGGVGWIRDRLKRAKKGGGDG